MNARICVYNVIENYFGIPRIEAHSTEWLRFEIKGAQFLKEIAFDTLSTQQKLIQELSGRKKKLIVRN